jgi:hypothetical protein
LSLLGLTALTTLSQRWNTLSWLAGVVVVVALVGMQMAVAVLAVFYLLLDTLLLLAHQLLLLLVLEAHLPQMALIQLLLVTQP